MLRSPVLALAIAAPVAGCATHPVTDRQDFGAAQGALTVKVDE